MAKNPVQIVLNTRDYFVVPEPGRRGPAKDFFAGRDAEFIGHREKLVKQAASIATSFQRSGMPSGVVKVRMRREAWAKSHRPERALFIPTKRPCVGASGIGEIYYSVTPQDIAEIQHQISAAEDATRWREHRKTGKKYASPSNARSDVGAIETIELPGASEKRNFGVEAAVRWLSDPRTSGAYFVELFSLPPIYDQLSVGNYYRSILEKITAEAEAHHIALDVFPVDIPLKRGDRPSSIFGVRLVNSANQRVFSPSARDHSRLLVLLDSNPLVRRILLPPIILPSLVAPPLAGGALEIPQRETARSYPKVGVVDGGIAKCLGNWIVGSHEIIAPEHQKVSHGTFISGLLVAGQSLNGPIICAELDGCDLFDISILPDTEQPGAFELYYPNGIVDFISELTTGVEAAKKKHGVRIFNMSLNLIEPVEDGGYGVFASLLDRISDQNDSIFVVSAGNLKLADCRSEWPANAQQALQYLASRMTTETLFQPAESSRSIVVGALNPPGCPDRLEGAPTAYTRRGPGLRVGVKPDVAHFGGAMPDATTQSGLAGYAEDGHSELGHGTSYSTPLVAKCLSTLDTRVVSPLSREVLIGMLIHSCETPKNLADKSLIEVARQFVGFGVPKSTDEMLYTSDHSITLVFADTLQMKSELQFDFAWPESLVDHTSGACRGDVRMTLVYRPPLNREFGAEFVRLNVDARLKQEDGEEFVSRMAQAYLPSDVEDGHFEHELVQHGLKWWPIKVYRGNFPLGRGKSSNWRVSLESLLRADEIFPPSGVP